jgi:uncharacterized protein (DUF342 family)
MEEEVKSQDGQVKVHISRDGLEAFVTVIGPRGEGKSAGLEEMRAALKTAGIVYGLDGTKIRLALEKENWDRTILIARGMAPVNGQDGRVEYKFSVSREHQGLIADQDEKVDYRNLNLIQNVQKGQPLAIRVEPTPGSKGITVTGKPIPARPGKSTVIRRGRNTVLDKDGSCLFSTIDGHVKIAGDRIEVQPLYEIRGDVDFSSGNINFIGDVTISGGVTSGFEVKAGGDIEVDGVVESARVESGGNITLHKGIAGAEKGMIQADGAITARFIENARVMAGGDVTVSDAIFQSIVWSGASVRCEGRKGTIVGGKIQARDEISARVIGSTLATQTNLEVGIDPALREEYRILMGEYRDKKKALELAAQNLQSMQQLARSPENLSSSRRLVLIKLLEDYKVMQKEITRMEKRQAELEREFNRVQRGRIRVFDVVYPGVHIAIGRAIYVVNDPIKYAMFILEDGEVKLTSLS